MLADFMPPLYVAALYGASRLATIYGNPRQLVVLDAMALNWLACEFAQIMVAYPRVVAAYICIDIASAIWISMKVKGRCAGIAEAFYVAMILFNSAFFFKGAFDEWTHWKGASIISWGQLIFVAGGMFRHGLGQIARRAVSSMGLQRYLAFGDEEIKP